MENPTPKCIEAFESISNYGRFKGTIKPEDKQYFLHYICQTVPVFYQSQKACATVTMGMIYVFLRSYDDSTYLRKPNDLYKVHDEYQNMFVENGLVAEYINNNWQFWFAPNLYDAIIWNFKQMYPSCDEDKLMEGIQRILVPVPDLQA